MVDEITEHCCIGVQSGELTSSKGSFTVVPESGDNIDVLVSCTDSVTGIHWCENYSEYLPCSSGSDIPVTITPTSNIIAVNERFSFDYLINRIPISRTIEPV